MRIFSKNAREYVEFSWKYALLVFSISLLMLLGAWMGMMPVPSSSPLVILVLLAVAAAGWNSRRQGFSLWQALIVGILCSTGNLWLVPIAIMSYLEELGVPQDYLMINLLILSLISIFFNLLILEACAAAGSLSSSIFIKRA
jgi:hypothetical protein